MTVSMTSLFTSQRSGDVASRLNYDYGYGPRPRVYQIYQLDDVGAGGKGQLPITGLHSLKSLMQIKRRIIYDYVGRSCSRVHIAPRVDDNNAGATEESCIGSLCRGGILGPIY